MTALEAARGGATITAEAVKLDNLIAEAMKARGGRRVRLLAEVQDRANRLGCLLAAVASLAGGKAA